LLLPRKRARGTSARCENPKDISRIRELVVVVIVVRLTLFFLFFDPLPLPPKRQILEILLERKDLSESQSASTMAALLEGAHPAQIAAFLVLLRAKGETGEEVAGLARAMLESGVEVALGAEDLRGRPLLDIVGTGGDGIGSVNISTGATVIAAAADGAVAVAKHGNRSVSSLCGSADVVEALGVALELHPEGIRACVREAGIAFMYAPAFHPAMAAVGPVRRALRVRTAFNLLGPLLNPARASRALVGVYSPSVAPLMAAALGRLGVERALVVHSAGMDELTPLAPAIVIEASGGKAGKPYE
jgi:anthranilate phosphoribosyltransferase